MECSSVINKKTTNTHKSVDESHAYHSQWKRAAQKATDSKTPLLWYALKSETTGREVSGCQRLYMRAAHAKSLQPCPTLCDLMDCSLLGSSVHGFSRQEYWSGLPCPPPGDLPNLESNPHLLSLLHWQTGSLPLVPPGKPETGSEEKT